MNQLFSYIIILYHFQNEQKFIILIIDNIMSQRVNIKRIKKQTQGYQSFDNLITNQQQQINQMNLNYGKIKYQQSRKIENRQIDQQEEIDISIQDIKKKDSEKMALLVGQLLAKNKINAKNAFEIPLLNINQPSENSDFPNDNLWKRFSSTLDSNQKIYGYRVDATHNYTYRVLQSIARQQKKENEDQQDEANDRQQIKKERFMQNSFNAQFAHHEADDFGKHLQKNYRNISILHLDTFFNVNPVLEKTKRIFDQNGLKGLLFNNLQINQELVLRITLGKEKSTYFLKKNLKQIDSTQDNIEQIFKQSQQTLDKIQINAIYRKIQYLCRKNNITGNDGLEMIKRQYDEIQQLWRLLEEEFAFEQDENNINMKGRILNNYLQQDQVKQEPAENNEIRQKNIDLQANERAVQGQILQNPQITITSLQQQNIDNKLSSTNQIANLEQQNTICNEVQIISQIISDMLQVIDKQFETFQNSNSVLYPSILIDQIHQNSHNQSDQTSKQDQSSSIIRTQPQKNQLKKQLSFSYNKNSRSFSKEKDFILRQITDIDYQQGQRVDNVGKWKSNQNKKVKAQRIKKQPKQKNPIRIHFYEERQDEIIIEPQKLSHVFKLDKSKRKQLKSIIKDMKKQNIIENNAFKNTSSWTINYNIKTYLKQYCLKEQNQVIQDQDQDQTHNIPQCEGINKSTMPQYIDISLIEQNLYDQIKINRNVSIRQAKEKIHKMIFSQQKPINFSQIFYKFHINEGNISPALCFLTILHLTNQHGLNLIEDPQQHDFIISLK